MTLVANRTEKRRLRRGTGLETLVDLTTTIISVLMSIIAFGLLMTFSLWGAAASVSVLAGAFLQWLLMRCLSEHLRLQKKIAGIEFEGTITGPAVETIWTCDHCGQMLYSETRCDSCNAQIVQHEVSAG